MSDVSSKPHVLWSALSGVAWVMLLYLVAPIVGSLLLSGFISSGQLADSGTLTQFLFIAVVEALTVGGLLAFLKFNKSSLKAIGLVRPKLKHIGLGILVYPAYFIAFAALVIVVSQLIPALDVNQEQQLGFDSVVGTSALVVTFISLVILPPIVEELTVRGLLFTSLRKRFGMIASTVVTSALFAAAHLSGGGSGGPLYIAALDTFVLSLVLCYMREKTGSLWPCITLHALKNGIAFVSLYIIVVR